jgi:hypothetical protein
MRYLRQTGQLCLVLVCDQCGAERTELGNLDYTPHPLRSSGHASILCADAGGPDAGTPTPIL